MDSIVIKVLLSLFDTYVLYEYQGIFFATQKRRNKPIQMVGWGIYFLWPLFLILTILYSMYVLCLY